MRPSARACALGVALALLAQPLAAQGQGSGGSLPVRAEVRLVQFYPSTAYASACGHSPRGLGLALRTRGRGHLVGFVERYGEAAGEASGDDLACAGAQTDFGTLSYPLAGGLDPDRILRLGAGAGISTGGRWVALGVEARIGAVRGRPGWGEERERAGARILPWQGYALALILLDRAVLTSEIGWTLLPLREEVHPWWGTGEPPRRGEHPFEVRDRHRMSAFQAFSLAIRF